MKLIKQYIYILQNILIHIKKKYNNYTHLSIFFRWIFLYDMYMYYCCHRLKKKLVIVIKGIHLLIIILFLFFFL